MKKIALQTINVISIATMVYFAIPKILAYPKSVEGFRQFESLVPLDPNFFRMFTGLSEMSIALLILYFSISHKKKIGLFVYSFLLVTMIAALVLEFFARPKPEVLLVVIAIILMCFSIVQLTVLKKEYYDTSK